jgi:hypothetical protein
MVLYRSDSAIPKAFGLEAATRRAAIVSRASCPRFEGARALDTGRLEAAYCLTDGDGHWFCRTSIMAAMFSGRASRGMSWEGEAM